MAFTGYDAPEHGGPIDMTGGGLDPSYAWALAPGGRFPGDEWAYLEYLAAKDPSQSRIRDGIGPGDSDPNYNVPDWLTNHKGLISKLLSLHEKNVREHGGLMNPGNPQGAGGNSFYSGPGADYGPLTGPTRGLVDQNTGNIFDGPDHRPEGSSDSTGGGGGRRGGGGGGYNGPVGPMQPKQPNFHASFLGWQPSNTGAPQFTGPANPTAPIAPPRAPGPTPPPGGFQGRWRGPNRGGGGGGGQGTGGHRIIASGPGGGTTIDVGDGGGSYTIADAARELGLSPEDLAGLGLGMGAFDKGHAPKQDLGGINFRGYDINALGGNEPGHLHDPSAGIYDTAGMPLPTLAARQFGESWDDYATRLHDLGFSMADIGGQSGPAGWMQGGNVVRGDGGYHFGNFAGPGEDTGRGFTIAPDGTRRYYSGGGAGGAGAGGITYGPDVWSQFSGASV